MQYSNTTNKDGILQFCEDFCKLGDGGITDNTILKYKFAGYCNQIMDQISLAILAADKNWRVDDTGNYGNFGVATTDLVSGQRAYVLPRATNSSDQSTLWKVYKVRIKDTNGVWYDLIPLASDEDENNSNAQGRPTKYRLLGNSIRLSDIPSTGTVTLDDGLQVWFQREHVRFEDSDTTKVPQFISGYHRLLPLGMSAIYMLPIDSKLSANYLALYNQGIQEMVSTYATRNDDPQITKRITPNIENTK